MAVWFSPSPSALANFFVNSYTDARCKEGESLWRHGFRHGSSHGAALSLTAFIFSEAMPRMGPTRGQESQRKQATRAESKNARREATHLYALYVGF